MPWGRDGREMESRMSNQIRLYMSMSLDGYIAGPDDRPGQELGRAGGRLFKDEMEIHLIPVLLGDGRRLFDHLGDDHIELDLVRRLEDRDVTHLRYRVRRAEEA